MIVISMIAILMSISLFPYHFYMDRARVEWQVDALSQEWILAHNEVKNGLLYADNMHAHLYLTFATGSNIIELSVSTGGTSDKKYYKSIVFDEKIKIQSFTGIDLWGASRLIYHITPPLGKWYYMTGDTDISIPTGVKMTLWYDNASLESGRARKILLRPYY